MTRHTLTLAATVALCLGASTGAAQAANETTRPKARPDLPLFMVDGWRLAIRDPGSAAGWLEIRPGMTDTDCSTLAAIHNLEAPGQYGCHPTLTPFYAAQMGVE